MSEESDMQMKVGQIQVLYEEAKGDLETTNERMTLCSAELVGLKNQKADLSKELENVRLEVKKLSLTIARMKKERSAAEKAVTSLLKQHPWIETEKSAFGIRGGDYDFDDNKPAEASKLLKELKCEQDSLVRTDVHTFFALAQENSHSSNPLRVVGQEDQQEGNGHD